MSAESIPACWTWPVTEVEHEQAFRAAAAGEDDTAQAGIRLLQTWQSGRCAVRGNRPLDLEADHDHDTGHLRGLLCRSCNVREGLCPADSPVFCRYRLRPPTEILGVRCFWVAPDSPRAVTATLGPDPVEALARHQAERDPARRR